MLKMFDTRTKIDETKLINDSLVNKDIELEEVFEVIHVSNEENHRSWLKGFAAGSSSVAIGLILGVAIGNVIVSKSKS